MMSISFFVPEVTEDGSMAMGEESLQSINGVVGGSPMRLRTLPGFDSNRTWTHGGHTIDTEEKRRTGARWHL